MGLQPSGGASGVAGVNNAGGVGVYGTGGTGVFGTGSNYGFVTDSNVQQSRTAGGWVKAMVEVNPFFSTPIIDAASTPLSPERPQLRRHAESDLEAIQIRNLYAYLQFRSGRPLLLDPAIDAFGTYLQLLKDGPSTLETATWDFSGNLKVAEYQLIVY